MSKASYQFTWNQPRISRLKQDVNKAMVTAAIDVHNAAKRNAPVGVYPKGSGRAGGTLRNSIRVDTDKKDQVYVLAGGKNGGKSVPYAKRREYENRKNPQTKFYMSRAFASLKDNYRKYFKGIAK